MVPKYLKPWDNGSVVDHEGIVITALVPVDVGACAPDGGYDYSNGRWCCHLHCVNVAVWWLWRW
jgi:hypothetical protein